jgi:hypothetical protein
MRRDGGDALGYVASIGVPPGAWKTRKWRSGGRPQVPATKAVAEDLSYSNRGSRSGASWDLGNQEIKAWRDSWPRLPAVGWLGMTTAVVGGCLEWEKSLRAPAKFAGRPELQQRISGFL